MLSVLDKLYCRIKKDDIRRLKILVKAMTIDVFYEALTKACWQFGVQYEILVKNSDSLVIMLRSDKRQVIIKFHKTFMVFMKEYEKFIKTLEIHGVRRGIYITTGYFEVNVLKNYKKVFSFLNKVSLEDAISFGRKQIGWKRNGSIIFKNNKFELNRYLP